MIHYRHFRNSDPPLLCEVWNACLAGNRTVSIPPRATSILEVFSLSKPYFEREGLLLAFDDTVPIGLVHAGFGPSPNEAEIDPAKGVVCALGVIPSHRRQGVGRELLRRAENYLHHRGSQEILAGPVPPANPYTFALYGGCDSVGFLTGEGMARPFFEKLGYRISRTMGLFRRSLKRLQIAHDPRFAAMAQHYEILGAPYSSHSFYREAVLGPIEAVEYRLETKDQHRVQARIVLWDMATFGLSTGETGVGLLGLEVLPTARRQGLGKFLLTQVLFHLHQQTFDYFEARADLEDVPAMNLLRGLGFEQVETGHCFRREATV